MAIKLPKYTRQVGASAESGSVRGDPGSAGIEYAAMGRAVGAATQAITGLVQNNEKVLSNIERGEYKKMQMEAKDAAQAAMDKHLQEGGDYNELPAIVDAEMTRFDATVAGSNWKSRAADENRVNWQYDRAGLLSQADGMVADRIRSDHLENLEVAYHQAVTPEEKEEARDAISQFAGDKVANNVAKAGEWSEYRILSEAAEAQYLEDNDPAAYIESLNNLPMPSDPVNKKAAIANRDATINNVVKQTGYQAKREWLTWKKEFVDGNLDAANARELEKYMGPNYAESLQRSLESGELMQPVSDADTDKGMTALNDFMTGNMAWSEFLRTADEVGGQVGLLMKMTSADIVTDQVEHNNHLNAYEVAFMDKKVPVVKGLTGEYVSIVADMVETYPGSAEEYVQGKMLALGNFMKANPGVKKGDEAWDEFVDRELGADARTLDQMRKPDVPEFATEEEAIESGYKGKATIGGRPVEID